MYTTIMYTSFLLIACHMDGLGVKMSQVYNTRISHFGSCVLYTTYIHMYICTLYRELCSMQCRFIGIVVCGILLTELCDITICTCMGVCICMQVCVGHIFYDHPITITT